MKQKRRILGAAAFIALLGVGLTGYSLSTSDDDDAISKLSALGRLLAPYFATVEDRVLLIVDCRQGTAFRNVTKDSPAFAVDSLLGKSVFKAGQNKPFATIEGAKVEKDDFDVTRATLKLSRCEANYLGPVATYRIDDFSPAERMSLSHEDLTASLAAKIWEKDHNEAFAPEMTHGYRWSLGAKKPCDRIEQLIGEQRSYESGAPHTLLCFSNGSLRHKVVSRLHFGVVTEDASNKAGYRIVGAADWTQEGSPSLLVYDWYYEGSAFVVLDFSKEKVERRLIASFGIP